MNAAKVVQRNTLVFWRMWKWNAIFAFINPLLFLGAMGLGIGTLVGEQNAAAFGDVGYLPFFATGMLVATCMQSGAFAASYPIRGKMTWQKNYEAMLATPLRVPDLFFGELGWTCCTLTLVALPFFLVMTLFGVPESPWAILSVPVAILVGLGFAASVMAFTASLETDAGYNWLFRFVITPLFLFSGTFFPIDSLPGWAQAIANALPTYHGIELVRGLNFGGLTPGEVVWHLGFLVAFLAAGTFVGIRLFNKRLVA